MVHAALSIGAETCGQLVDFAAIRYFVQKLVRNVGSTDSLAVLIYVREIHKQQGLAI